MKLNQELLINIYHDLLINDYAVIRGNFPAVLLFRPGKNKFSYYINDFIMESNTSRCLSPLLVVYSIVNAIAHSTCGIEVPGPNSTVTCLKTIDDKCALEVRKRLTELLEEHSSADRIVDSIMDLIDYLERNKLLHVIKRMTKDNVWPDRFLDKLGEASTNNVYVVDIGNEEDLVSLKTFSIIYRCLLKIMRPEELKDLINKINKKYGSSTKCFEECNCFKTTHGELLRLASNAGSLPLNKANYESLVLPFIMEPRVSFTQSADNREDIVGYVPIEKLGEILSKYFLGSKQLELDSEYSKYVAAVVQALIQALVNNNYKVLTRYQFVLLKDMLERDEPFISLLAAPTGSGKTLVFTIYILAKILKEKINNKRIKALLIYPRKSLARDQLRRFIELLYELNKLLEKIDKSLIIGIGIRDGDSLTRTRLRNRGIRYDNFRDIELYGVKKICHGFSDNGEYEAFIIPAKENCDTYPTTKHEKIDWLVDVKRISMLPEKIDIVITNMHMITKIVNNLLLLQEDNNPWKDFIDTLKIIVVDEAHVYTDSRELTLASLTLSKLLFLIKYLRRIRGQEERLQVNIILSSATMSNSEYFQKIKQGGEEYELSSKNILGISLIPLCESNNIQIPEELLSFAKILVGKDVFRLYEDLGSIIYRDYWTALICANTNDSKYRSRHKTSWRIILPAITFPIPTKSSNTSLLETWISIIHWVLSLRQKAQSGIIKLNPSSIIFIDNKDTIKTVIDYMTRRQILEAKDHADRVLLTSLYPNRPQAEDQINKILRSFTGKTLFEALWSKQFSDFQHLSLYLNYDEQIKIKVPTNLSNLVKNPVIASLSSIIEDINRYASDINVNRLGDIPKIIIHNYRANKYRYLYYLWHHADLNKEIRSMIEEELKKGNIITVTSTSTLEVGVDIPNLSVIVQYGATTGTAELHQRFGRAGRSIDSMFISLGLLVLRNTGQDIHLLIEDNAIDYVYNLFIPSLSDPREDVNLVLQQLAPIAVSSRIIGSHIEDLVSFINNEYKNEIIDELERIKTLYDDSLKLINSIFSPEHCSISIEDLFEDILEILKDEKKKLMNIIGSGMTDVKSLFDQLIRLTSKLQREAIISLFDYYVILFDKMLRYLHKLRIRIRRKYGANSGKVIDLENTIKVLRREYNNVLNIYYCLVMYNIIEAFRNSGYRSRVNRRKFIDTYVRNLIYPRIASDIGTFEYKYLLIKFSDLTDIEVSDLSFDTLIRRILPLKHE